MIFHKLDLNHHKIRTSMSTVLTPTKSPTVVMEKLNIGFVLGDKKTALYFVGWLLRRTIERWPKLADPFREAIAIEEAIHHGKLTKKKKKR